MLPVLVALMIISLSEMLIWTAVAWRWRRFMGGLIASLVALASLALIITDAAAWTLILAVLSAYRCMNLARVSAGHIQQDHLFHSSRRTSAWLISCQVVLLAVYAASRHFGITGYGWWAFAAGAGLAGAVIVLASVIKHTRSHGASGPGAIANMAKKNLPSLTVAIPARNETDDLEACLQSLVASTYPKLEILVLDDCSQDKRTPEIIRSFAHGGVRFIAGTEPPDNWLAKNFAYDKLADAANGDLLMFCGVDVRFEPQSLDALVGTLLDDGNDMVSLLPRNMTPSSGGLSAWFMQPNRYAWELALPRLLADRPPVLSTCWIISRQALERSGGFEAVRRKGVPESYFARNTEAGKYAFLIADQNLGITSVKGPAEQRATSVRTRYLQLHRRPEVAALISLLELGLLVLPLPLALTMAFQDRPVIAAIAGLGFILETIAYSKIVSLTYRRFILKGVWLLPFAAVYDVALLNYSMWRYEFREVIWKGRNVCVPVMRAIPELPDN